MDSCVQLGWTRIVWKTDLGLGNADATRVRGFLGRRWHTVTAFHQHAKDGSLVYQHPLIQTKVINGQIMITGLAEGAMILEVLPNPRRLSLAQRVLDIVDEERERGIVTVGPTDKHTEYRFLTSWLPLNQANHVKYLERSGGERRDLLSRILIGNVLSFSKAIRLNVQSRLQANHNFIQTNSVEPKGIELLGFTGTFTINFSLPDFWGIGKFSSRGFGTLMRRQIDGEEVCGTP
ncbi:MAG: CRISPR-associated endonuclease Cas6 [Pseudomonadota bacterium]